MMSNAEQNNYSRESTRAEENKILFINKLDQMQNWLTDSGISYRILGSLAVASYLQPDLKLMNFNRGGGFSSDQKVPDVDLLVPKKHTERVYQYGQKLLEDESFPIRLDVVAGIKHIDLQEGHKTSFLTHKDLSVPIDTKLFMPVVRQFGSTSIVTVDSQTLLHTFGVWGGILREKDLPGVRSLIRYNQTHEDSEFSERDFSSVHQFLKERKKEYPLYIKARKAEMAIGSILPKSLENFLRVIYKRIDARRGKA